MLVHDQSEHFLLERWPAKVFSLPARDGHSASSAPCWRPKLISEPCSCCLLLSPAGWHICPAASSTRRIFAVRCLCVDICTWKILSMASSAVAAVRTSFPHLLVGPYNFALQVWCLGLAVPSSTCTTRKHCIGLWWMGYVVAGKKQCTWLSFSQCCKQLC